MGSINLHQEGFDFTQASEEDVYFAFVLRLPFRLKVKGPYHCHFKHRGQEYDIWIQHKSIGETRPDSPLVWMSQQGLEYEDLLSTAAIIPNKSKIEPHTLNSIRSCESNVNKIALQPLKQVFEAIQALNAFIVGYHTATGEIVGGQPLQTITSRDYFEKAMWEVCIIGIPLSFWNEDTIDQLFNLKGSGITKLGSWSGGAADLPAEKVAGINSAIDRLNNFYFYELAFEAKAKMLGEDYIGALLMAVAALEGVHAVFVMQALREKLPKDRKGEYKDLEENFIKELGFSLCNKLTPYLFMDDSERPPQELIQKVATAVKYRNEIMHALRNSSGTYRIRTRTNLELSEAYSATLVLYDFYRRAFEKIAESS